MSTVGTAHAHTLRLTLPRYGQWRLDAVLEGGDVPAEGSTVSALVGDLELTGKVLRAGFDAPDRPHVVLVGGLGWETPLAAPVSYQSDASVMLSTVLDDLARRAGETLERPADVPLGLAYASPARRTVRDALNALALVGYTPPWRVDSDGVTRYGDRVGTTVTARSTIIRRNFGVSLRIVGIDSPAAFLPGNTLVDGDANVLITRAVVDEATNRLEVEVWS